MPNASLWNVPLKNYSRNPRRLMTIQLRVGYDTDTEAARRVLLDMAAADARILREPPPQVAVESFTDNLVVLTFRAWAMTLAFVSAQRTMSEEAKRRLQAAGVKMSV